MIILCVNDTALALITLLLVRLQKTNKMLGMQRGL